MFALGGGQDSFAILAYAARHPEFLERYAPHDRIVVMSATGNEHQETDDYVAKWAAPMSAAIGAEFIHITADMGYHTADWASLGHFFEVKNRIGSKAYPKSCTDQLKIRPIYRFLEAYVGRRYGLTVGRKKGFYEYTAKYGKLKVLLGITAEEATRRIATPDSAKKDAAALWMQRCIDRVYPLVDMGWDRKHCQDYMIEIGQPVPLPSNCMMCPFVSEIELLWLWTFRRSEYDRWVVLEANKLARDQDKGEKNFGVFGRTTLPEVLVKAKAKFGHMTEKELWDYKMSHGHGVCSKY